MMKRIRFRHIFDGEIIETDLLILRPDQGEEIPGEDKSEWSCCQIGRYLYAVNLMLPTNCFMLTVD